jgi:AcrR family transcriptional regulator
VQAKSAVEASPQGRGGKRALVRGALLRAAQALMDEGRVPTVSEVADHAGVSRATAYRQFSSAEALVAEAALDRIAAGIAELAPGAVPAPDPEAAIEALVRRVFAMVVENDAAFRTMLRLALDGGPGSRGGRRLAWVEAAIAPWRDRFAPDAYARLVPALGLTLGIETWVALRDIAGLDRARAEETAVWTARALVARALTESRGRG